MVSKCANPGCDARLHYFRDGRLYQFETRSGGGASVRQVRNYWLCGPCSARLALTLSPGKGVEVIPLSLASHLHHACAGVPLD